MREGVVLDVTNRIKPKEESDIYNGQRYIIRFDPNAPEGSRWVWQVNYAVVYPHIGSAPTIDKARNATRRTIRRLQGEHEHWTE